MSEHNLTESTAQQVEETEKNCAETVHFDPEWRFEDLNDAQQRILAVEIANPNIKVVEIAKMVGISYGLVSTYRNDPKYKKFLIESRKDEYQLLKDMRLLAAQRLRGLLSSKDENIRLQASKFILSTARDIDFEKAKMQVIMELKKQELELKKQEIMKPVQKTVRVIFGGSHDIVDGEIQDIPPAVESSLKETTASVESQGSATTDVIVEGTILGEPE